MRAQLLRREAVDQRVLGALRLVDGTTHAPIDDGLRVQAPDAAIARNRSGLYVIRALGSLAAHEAAFDAPPASPPVGTVPLRIDIRDPAGRYLDRRVTLALPRDADPARAGAADSLFQPVTVAVYPGANAAMSGNWVELRVTVRGGTAADALGGALVRVVAGGRVLARGLTDWRGEALVPVAGVPVTTWSTEPGAVVVTETAALIECVFDPAEGLRTPIADVRGGRTPGLPPLPDPDRIDAARATLPQASVPAQLAAGRRLAVAVNLLLP